MKIMYKEFKIWGGDGEVISYFKTVDGKQVLSIPIAENNTDYQEYLKWVAEGNTPEPADE